MPRPEVRADRMPRSSDIRRADEHKSALSAAGSNVMMYEERMGCM